MLRPIKRFAFLHFPKGIKVKAMVGNFMGKLLRRTTAGPGAGTKVGPNGRIPDGERLYAIGDIHGRADLLQALHTKIAADCAATGLACTMVYLGDYIDRGLESRQVINLLLAPADDGVERIFLLGNHEAMLLDFLNNPRGGAAWLRNGGIETLHSYGVTPPKTDSGPAGMDEAHQALGAHMPSRHLAFFQNLRLCHQFGDYFFVHAGVRPGVPLGQQIREDMIWIRNEFLNSREDFGKIIVHGHSIRDTVDERPNRIGIDTGAYTSGKLTTLVLEGAERKYLST